MNLGIFFSLNSFYRLITYVYKIKTSFDTKTTETYEYNITVPTFGILRVYYYYLYAYRITTRPLEILCERRRI